AAGRIDAVDEALGEFAVIETFVALGRDQFERRGDVGVLEYPAGFRRGAIVQVQRGRPGIALDHVDARRDALEKALVWLESFTRDADRRRERLCQRQLAVVLREPHQAGRLARNRCRQRAVARLVRVELALRVEIFFRIDRGR